MSVVFSGIPVAIIVNYPLSSALCESNIDGGWPLVFYIPGTINYLLGTLSFNFKAKKSFSNIYYPISGAAGVLWCFIFQIYAHSTPETHPRISAEEKNFLQLSCNRACDNNAVKSVPWKQIVLSKKVHGLWITHLSSAWGYYLLAISLPTFSEEVLKLSVINVRKFDHKLRQFE